MARPPAKLARFDLLGILIVGTFGLVAPDGCKRVALELVGGESEGGVRVF